MTVDRGTVRKELAALLDNRLTSIVERVFPYQVGDLKGISPAVIVTGAGSNRATALVSLESTIMLEVHTFVLYSLRPVQSNGAVTAGTDAIIPLSDTSIFSVDMKVYLEDDNNDEISTVTAVTANTSIKADLVNSYVNPRVFVWTEEQSEDLLDTIEHDITDEVRLANDDGTWLAIANNGESVVDVVDLGGDAYRHETIPVLVTVVDF